MEEKEKANLYKDVVSLDGIFAYNDQEKLVPPKKSLKGYVFYGLDISQRKKTFGIIIITYILSHLFYYSNGFAASYQFLLQLFGINVSFIVLILFSIHLLRASLNIKDKVRCDGALILYCGYSFVCALTSMLFILANYALVEFLVVTTAFFNIFFGYGFLITFSLFENRTVWTYIKFFRQAMLHNISTLFVLALIGVICYVLHIPSFISYSLTAYVIMAMILSWAKFLYSHVYPKI